MGVQGATQNSCFIFWREEPRCVQCSQNLLPACWATFAPDLLWLMREREAGSWRLPLQKEGREGRGREGRLA